MDRGIVAWSIALIVGAAIGLFRIVAVLFGDGPGSLLHPNYLQMHGFTAILYAATAFCLGWITHRAWHPSLALLALPGIFFVLYFVNEATGLRVLAAASIVVGILLGVGGNVVRERLDDPQPDRGNSA